METKIQNEASNRNTKKGVKRRNWDEDKDLKESK